MPRKATSSRAAAGSGTAAPRTLPPGRPVVAQDTGFGESLPTGAGLFAFSDVDGVLTAIEALRADYGRQTRAARAIAEEHLDSRRVLTRILQAVGALPPAGHRSVHETPDAELAELLGALFVSRRPFEYRSSAPIAVLQVDGRTLLLKDLSRGSLTERVRAAKLDFLHDPRREPEVYRSLLAGAGLWHGGALAAVVIEPQRERYWLVVEKVPGIELYQVGEHEEWLSAARWLARCHDHFAGLPPTEYLLRYDRRFFDLWPARAALSLPGYESVDDPAGEPPADARPR